MDARDRCWITQKVFLIIITLAPMAYSQCSNPKSRICLSAIRNTMNDNSIFWFGESYPIKCSLQSKYSAACYNPLANFEDSLTSRIFQRRSFNSSSISSLLNVTYVTHMGNYTACGHEYSVPRSRTVRIDPFNKDQGLTPFQLVSSPYISWDISRSQPGTLHSLVMIDAGYLIVNALYINIPDNSLEEGQTIVDYHPPINPSPNDNPYVFLLFQQTGPIYLPTQWLQLLALRSVNKMEDFLIKFDLQGPTSVSWFTVRVDPYSADEKHSLFQINSCVQFVNKSFKRRRLPYLQKQIPDLSVYIDITFQTPAIEFTCCCNNYSYTETKFKPNPIGNGEAHAELARTDAKVTFLFQKATVFPLAARDFENEIHSLLMADGDIPAGTPFGSSSKPYNHMFVVNIKRGNFNSGQVLLPYQGPAPLGDTYHNYYFLLFKQRREIHPQLAKYSYSGCPRRLTGRCAFDVAAMIKDFDLELVGASWQLTKNTEFVRCTWLMGGGNETEICADFKGYTENCLPKNYSPSTNDRFGLFVLLIIASMLLMPIVI